MNEHHDINAERTVLANGLHYGRKAWDRICRAMPEHTALWRPGHRMIAQAITDLLAEGNDPACVASAVVELLGKRNVRDSDVSQLDHMGGFAELATIQACCTTSMDMAPARRVWELYRRRTLVGVLDKARRSADQAASDVDAIANSLASTLRDGLPLNPGTMTTVADIEADTGMHRVDGARWGIAKLDDASPLHRQTLVVIAAPPGGGKTSVACWVAVQSASKGCKVGIISLEMSDKQIAGWIRKCQDACGYVVESHVIVKKTVLTHAQIGPAVREMADAGCGIVVVDHVQKVRPVHPAEKIFDTVSKASAALNDAANQCNVALIACCQVSGASRKPVRNRAGQVSGASEVAASDLRGSGDIEQDAAVILTIWREDSEDHGPTPIMNFRLAKNRFGACCKFQVRADFRDCTLGPVDGLTEHKRHNGVNGHPHTPKPSRSSNPLDEAEDLFADASRVGGFR